MPADSQQPLHAAYATIPAINIRTDLDLFFEEAARKESGGDIGAGDSGSSESRELEEKDYEFPILF